jgi:hypothetical protein
MDTFYTTGYLRLDIYYPFLREEIHPLSYQSLNIPSYQAIIFFPISGMLSALYDLGHRAGIIGRSRKFHPLNDLDCPEIGYASGAKAKLQQKISRGQKWI